MLYISRCNSFLLFHFDFRIVVQLQMAGHQCLDIKGGQLSNVTNVAARIIAIKIFVDKLLVSITHIFPLTFNLLIMIVKPLQTAWNQTRRRVTRNSASGQAPSCFPLSQYVF